MTNREDLQRRQIVELEKAMETHKRYQTMADENQKLREILAMRQPTLVRLQKLSTAAATLISSVDMLTEETTSSSLAYLAKLELSTAVTPPASDRPESTSLLVVGQYLHQLLAIIFSAVQESQGDMTVIQLLHLEARLYDLFVFAEDRGIVPFTEETTGWKKELMTHKRLLEDVEADAP